MFRINGGPAFLFSGAEAISRDAPFSKLSTTKLNSFQVVLPDFMSFGDKLGESLGGSQAPPSFWKLPGLPGS